MNEFKDNCSIWLMYKVDVTYAGTGSSRKAYSYFSEEKLSPGDFVVVQAGTGLSVAKVSSVSKVMHEVEPMTNGWAKDKQQSNLMLRVVISKIDFTNYNNMFGDTYEMV